MEQQVDEVNKRIKIKEDIVRKLKMVKVHRTKHDAKELDQLIQTWLAACQQALQDLEEKLKENKSSESSAEIKMEMLLKHMHIEPELVGYSVEDETFM